MASNRYLQNLNARLRLPPLLLHLEDAGDGLSDVLLQLIDGLALRVAARKGWNLAPKPAVRILMNDNGVILHVSILSRHAYITAWKLLRTRRSATAFHAALPRHIIFLAMRELFLTCVVAASAFAQSGTLGPFTNSGDVGGPAIKGSTAFDAGTGQFRITGAGANIWAKEDQFQYVWREMSGNFAVTTTMEFLGQGVDHRKAGIMLRHSLDTDAPYVDIVIHGNGMPGIQWRNTKGDITNAVDFPFDGPAKYKLKLVRQGSAIAVSIARDGAGLKELAHTQVQLGNPVLVGLAVCSHKADASDTVIFSDVSVEQLPAPAGKKQ